MKIRPVGDELLHANRRTDGQTDTTKLIVAFSNFANAHEKKVDALTNVPSRGTVPNTRGTTHAEKRHLSMEGT